MNDHATADLRRYERQQAIGSAEAEVYAKLCRDELFFALSQPGTARTAFIEFLVDDPADFIGEMLEPKTRTRTDVLTAHKYRFVATMMDLHGWREVSQMFDLAIEEA